MNKKTLKNSKYASLIKRIMENAAPMIEEALLNEISSTTAYDAAERAEDLGQMRTAQRLKALADEKYQDETSQEYDHWVDEIAHFDEGGVDVRIAKFIPTNMYVLIWFKGQEKKSPMTIVRISRDKLFAIKNEVITNSIADSYDKARECVQSASTAVGAFVSMFNLNVKSTKKNPRSNVNPKGREFAIKLANFINGTVGSHINWRYFFNDKSPEITASMSSRSKKDDYGDAGMPIIINPDGELSDEYPEFCVGCVLQGKERTAYLNLYCYVSDGEHQSFVHISRQDKGIYLESMVHVNRKWEKLVELYPEEMKGYKCPARGESSLVVFYEWLMQYPRQLILKVLAAMSSFINVDGKNDKTLSVSMSVLERSYRAEVEKNELKAAEAEAKKMKDLDFTPTQKNVDDGTLDDGGEDEFFKNQGFPSYDSVNVDDDEDDDM